MKTRIAASALALTVSLAGAGRAAFVDGYQDRGGVFAGVNIGGGQGSFDADSGSDPKTVGFMGSVRAGAGVKKHLTLDMEISHWLGQDDVAGADVDLSQTGFLVNATRFFQDGFFLRGGAGFAVGKIDGTGFKSQSESGLAAHAAAGYEFFAGPDTAMNVSFLWRGHFLEDSDFNLLGLQVGVAWY
ncbi:MAG: outer membrane beta-barrel protein [Elusimicrobiota bacterium]